MGKVIIEKLSETPVKENFKGKDYPNSPDNNNPKNILDCKEEANHCFTVKRNKSGLIINSRKDFNKIINDFCKWLKDNDPSSFTYYYLQKAKESFGKNCWNSIDDFKKIMEFGSNVFKTNNINKTAYTLQNSGGVKETTANTKSNRNSYKTPNELNDKKIVTY